MLSIAAPAKLNLYLHITGKRADGYHLLESLVAFTEFGDRLDFMPGSELSLEVIGPFAGALKGDNLVMQAARLLQPYAGGKGARIVLHKHIPIGAGLGGGSSDAAAALKGLMQLWNITFDHETLMPMMLKLGSDVPVCFAAHPAIIRGIGEEIAPCDLPGPVWMLLANPGVPLLTADVYRKFSGAFDTLSKNISQMDTVDALIAFLKTKHNVLEKPAQELLPVINEMLAKMEQTPECLLAHMSGSGATCFGLYEKEVQAHKAAEIMAIHYPQGWHKVTRLI